MRNVKRREVRPCSVKPYQSAAQTAHVNLPFATNVELPRFEGNQICPDLSAARGAVLVKRIAKAVIVGKGFGEQH